MTPRASILIVNYNGWNDLQRCLKSLEPDALRYGYETIVVDNASTDGSAERICRFFPWARLVENPRNDGFGGGNNLGALAAGGEFLAFLNPDTTVEPGWLEALIGALESRTQTGMATAKILMLADPTRINTCGNEIHVSGLTLCRGSGQPDSAFQQEDEVAAVSGAAFAMRKELFERLGGFDPSFFMYMEDTDLSVRARLAGCSIVYTPDAVVHHDYTLTFGPRKTFYQERNRYLMLLKALRWRTLLGLAPALLAAEVVTWGYVLLRERGRAGNKLEAYAWVARNWGCILQKRAAAQAQRRSRDREVMAGWRWVVDFEQTAGKKMARACHLAFDPLFFVFKGAALLLAG